MSTKNAEQFFCEKCNFKCCKLSNFSKHNLTSKHIERIKKDTLQLLEEVENKFKCEKCGIQYKFHSGLSRHKKKCLDKYIFDNSNLIVNLNNSLNTLSNLSLEIINSNADLIKSNDELQKLLMKVNNNLIIHNCSK
jgi:hypothetical protein